MNRTTAVEVWREVCGSDLIMAMPPTGRLLEAFAARIEAAERERCAKLVIDAVAWCGGHGEPSCPGGHDLARMIRAS